MSSAKTVGNFDINTCTTRDHKKIPSGDAQVGSLLANFSCALNISCQEIPSHCSLRPTMSPGAEQSDFMRED